MSSSLPGAGFAIILGLIPIAVLIWLFSGIIQLECITATQMLLNLLIKSVAFSLFIPFILIAF